MKRKFFALFCLPAISGITSISLISCDNRVSVTGVSINDGERKCNVNETLQLSCTVTPSDAIDKSVTWSSSDTTVATIDQTGLVTGAKEGTATITVKTNDGNFEDSCLITVNSVHVESVTIDGDKAKSCEMKKTLRLSYKILPENATDKSVTWSSSQPNIATVDSNGLVKGISIGQSIITVKTNDGDKIARCTVDVHVVHVNSVSITQGEDVECNIGQKKQLTCQVLPENATNKEVTWLSDDTSIATIDDKGVITGVAEGQTTITVTTVDNSKTDTSTLTVNKVDVQSVTIDGDKEKLCEPNYFLPLTCTISPKDATDKSVTWLSSNPSVATIDSQGKIKGLANGQTTITVTTNDGSKTDTCTVYVHDFTLEDIDTLLLTPYKCDTPMIKENDYLVDSPSVFYFNNKWYMTYIAIQKNQQQSGYETYIAESDDLIHWGNKIKIFSREPETQHWDSRQIAGYMAFMNNELYGDYALQKVNDQHYIAYLGGTRDGYETDPLSMGEASFTNLTDPSSYHKFNRPILAPDDIDAREGEDLTIYKSYMFIDEDMTLGHKYVNFYNAKGKNNVESVFIAVSDDAETWDRYGDSYVYRDQDASITGDPIILKCASTYIMVYYTLKNGQTCDTFAISKDLVHWTPWQGEPLIKPTKPWENKYAHKPAIVYKDGILYHFYCAVNTNNERFIAVATSQEIKP